MAEKKKCKLDISIQEVDNGWKVVCRCEKKPSLSTRAGWVPSQYDEKEHVFKTAKEAAKHIEDALNEHVKKEK